MAGCVFEYSFSFPSFPEPCSNGLKKSDCSDNYPCRTAVCPNNPKAKCRVNRCGGCQAEFYYKSKKIDDCGIILSLFFICKNSKYPSKRSWESTFVIEWLCKFTNLDPIYKPEPDAILVIFKIL